MKFRCSKDGSFTESVRYVRVERKYTILSRERIITGDLDKFETITRRERCLGRLVGRRRV